MAVDAMPLCCRADAAAAAANEAMRGCAAFDALSFILHAISSCSAITPLFADYSPLPRDCRHCH